jgi:hypothetical protein
MSELEIQIYKSIQEIDPKVWDKIAAGRGFQSHNWYTFGERAMADCKPTYLLAMDGDTPVASAALFKIHNEPLPLPRVAREFMASVFKRRPLMVCRPARRTATRRNTSHHHKCRSGTIQKTTLLLSYIRLPANRTIKLSILVE